MNRLLLVAALIVAAGAALYVFVIRDDGDERPAEVAGADRPARDVPQPRVPRAPARGAALPGPDDTARPDVTVTPRPEGGEIRDHRSGDRGTFVRPGLPHPSQSPVQANVTAAVMKQVRPVVLKCLASVPESAYGARPVVMTRATISIDEQGTVSVHELVPAPTDIDESAAASALECIRAGAANMTTRVDDHPAVESAVLAFPIRPLDYRAK